MHVCEEQEKLETCRKDTHYYEKDNDKKTERVLQNIKLKIKDIKHAHYSYRLIMNPEHM